MPRNARVGLTKKAIVVVVAVIVVVALVASITLQLGVRRPRGGGYSAIQLYPAYNFSLIKGPFYNHSLVGSFSSNSEYSIVEVYSKGASVFASPFMWNVGYAVGDVNMTFYRDRLHVWVNLSQVNKITPTTPVDGYPGLMYGQEYWFPFGASTQQSPLLRLPMPVGDLPNFYSFLNYSLYAGVGTIDDFSYDIWLTQDPNTTYLEFPDIEVMIWMHWGENLSANQYFVHAGSLQIPTVVNGSTHNYTYQVYVLPRTGAADGWVGVYLLSPVQLEGDVGIPVAYVLKNLGLFTTYAGLEFNATGYYLDAIQVGMEFNDYYGNVEVGYNLYSWTIQVPASTDTVNAG